MRRRPASTALLAVLMAAACRSERDGVSIEAMGAARVASADISAEASRDARSEVTLRRLSTSGYVDFYASSISPDGRYLSMVDWSTTDLAVRDLGSGEVHRLTSVQRAEGEPYEDAGVSVFSHDGRRIVYGWQRYPDLQLRVMDFETGDAGVPRAAEPEVIFHNPEFYPYYPFDWSPDGRQILAKVYASGNTNQLALISTTDGTYRALKSFDWREPLRAEFSPDGRYVVYDFLPELGSANRDVFVISLDGTYEATIVNGPAIDRLLGWHPGGSILFHSDRGGTPGVWRIPMSDGQPAGPAELVKADMWGVEPLGFANGRFYYGVNVNPTRLYTAAVDFATGRLAGAPVPVDDPARIQIRGWDWSPDGRFLAYSGSTAGAGGSMIVIRSDRGEEVRTLRLELGATSRIRWTPDGKSLIVFARDGKARRGFHRVDLETGSYTTILRNDQLEDPTGRGDFDISPDGRTIWFATDALDDVRWTLVAYDLESGASRPITPVEWRTRGTRMGWHFARVSVSPDGAKLALVVPDTIPTTTDRWIGTMPVEGGAVTPLARVGGDRLIQGPEWTADGQSVVFATLRLGDRAEDEWTTWIVPANGGEARPLGLMEHVNASGMKLHPDGRRIAFLAGESRGEVWVMDGITGTAQRQAESEVQR